MKKRNQILLMAVLVAFAVVIAHAGSGLRDEIVDSFAVKPGGTLNFDSDLANVQIATSETDTLRAEFIRDVKVTVRWAGDRRDRELQKVRVNFRIAMPRKFNLDLRTVGSARIGNLDGT